MSSGRVFKEAATGNERRPTVDRRYDGTCIELRDVLTLRQVDDVGYGLRSVKHMPENGFINRLEIWAATYIARERRRPTAPGGIQQGAAKMGMIPAQIGVLTAKMRVIKGVSHDFWGRKIAATQGADNPRYAVKSDSDFWILSCEASSCFVSCQILSSIPSQKLACASE